MNKEQEKEIIQAHLVQAEADIFIHGLQKKEALAVKTKENRDEVDSAVENLDKLIAAAKAKEKVLKDELKAYE